VLRLRRLYFYLVAYVSLVMLLTGLATLVRVLLEQLLGPDSSGLLWGAFAGREQFREQTAFGIALSAIGLPAWLLHWRVAQGWLTASGVEGAAWDNERASGLRRLYLYGVLITTALTAYSAGRDLLAELNGLPFGLNSGADAMARLIRPLPYLMIAALFWAYHWKIADRDRLLAGEVGASATLRRWYVYGLAAFGVVPLMVNLTTLLQQLWLVLFDRGGLGRLGQAASAAVVAQSGGTVLAALAVWLLHRGWAERAAVARGQFGDNEFHAVLRKVYLYALVGGTVGWALINASQVVRFGLSSLLGVAPGNLNGEPVLVALGRPLVSIVIFGLFWLYFWAAVRRDTRAEPEVARQAGVRRIYYYLVAAVALSIGASSLAALLRLLTDALLLAPTGAPDSLRQELAANLSYLIIALPVWLLHWRAIERLVAAPSAALAETRATSRRCYLYLVALAAVAVVLGSGAWIVYEVSRVLLGQSFERSIQAEMARLVANAGVAGLLLWYHWWQVLRADQAVLRQAQRGRSAIATISRLDPAGAESLERYVREALTGARIKLEWSDARSGAEK
jgi:hypothetical protein